MPWVPRAVLLGCSCTGFAWTPASVFLERVPGSGAGALLWASRAQDLPFPDVRPSLERPPAGVQEGSRFFLLPLPSQPCSGSAGLSLPCNPGFPDGGAGRMMATCFVGWAVTEVSVNLLSGPLFLTQGRRGRFHGSFLLFDDSLELCLEDPLEGKLFPAHRVPFPGFMDIIRVHGVWWVGLYSGGARAPSSSLSLPWMVLMVRPQLCSQPELHPSGWRWGGRPPGPHLPQPWEFNFCPRGEPVKSKLFKETGSRFTL